MGFMFSCVLTDFTEFSLALLCFVGFNWFDGVLVLLGFPN